MNEYRVFIYAIIFSICAIGYCTVTIKVLIKLWKNDKSVVVEKKNLTKPTLIHEDVINIIGWCIKNVFDKRKALKYDLNNIQYYNIEDELSELSKEVAANIGKGTIEAFNFYFSEEYLMIFIVQTLELLLIDDLKSRRVSTQR